MVAFLKFSTQQVSSFLGVKESSLNRACRYGDIKIELQAGCRMWTLDNIRAAAKYLGLDANLSIRQKIQQLELKNVNPFEEAVKIVAQAENILKGN